MRYSALPAIWAGMWRRRWHRWATKASVFEGLDDLVAAICRGRPGGSCAGDEQWRVGGVHGQLLSCLASGHLIPAVVRPFA